MSPVTLHSASPEAHDRIPSDHLIALACGDSVDVGLARPGSVITAAECDLLIVARDPMRGRQSARRRAPTDRRRAREERRTRWGRLHRELPVGVRNPDSRSDRPVRSGDVVSPKDALAAKKAAGVQLGRPTSIPAPISGLIVEMRAAGLTLRDIVARLNAEGLSTARGTGEWRISTIQRVLARARNSN
jgi:Recombinase